MKNQFFARFPALLLACLLTVSPALAAVDWSQWNYGGGTATPAPTDQSESAVDWSQWNFESAIKYPKIYEHPTDDQLHFQSYLFPANYLGGMIAWDAWVENGMEYNEHWVSGEDELNEYLLCLQRFGYRVVTDTRLGDMRSITLVMEGTADLPACLALWYDASEAPTLVIAADANFSRTHDLDRYGGLPVRETTDGLTLLERRTVTSFTVTADTENCGTYFYPQSLRDDLFTVTRQSGTKSKGPYTMRVLANGNVCFLAVHVRAREGLCPSPQKLGAYSVSEEDALHLAAYLGVEKGGDTAGELALTPLPAAAEGPLDFWVMLPMRDLYAHTAHQLYLPAPDALSWDPAKVWVVAVPPAKE